MGKIRYLIFGAIIVGIFALIHLVFPRQWSQFLQNTDLLFTNPPWGFRVLYGFCVFFFFAFVILFGVGFLACFGKPSYPEGSEGFTPPISVVIPALNEENIITDTLEFYAPATLEILLWDKDKYPELFKESKEMSEIKFPEGGRSITWFNQYNSVKFITELE